MNKKVAIYVIAIVVFLSACYVQSSPSLDYDNMSVKEYFDKLLSEQPDIGFMESLLHRYRKNNRQPQLRLRFGKRSGLPYRNTYYQDGHVIDNEEN